jgi:hypothetical protein
MIDMKNGHQHKEGDRASIRNLAHCYLAPRSLMAVSEWSREMRSADALCAFLGLSRGSDLGRGTRACSARMAAAAEMVLFVSGEVPERQFGHGFPLDCKSLDTAPASESGGDDRIGGEGHRDAMPPPGMPHALEALVLIEGAASASRDTAAAPQPRYRRVGAKRAGTRRDGRRPGCSLRSLRLPPRL